MKLKLRLLIVEDDRMTREVVADKLKDAFDTTLADDLRECRIKVDNSKPDAILLDLSLPGSRPSETLQEVKKFSGNTPIIVFSAISDPDIIRSTIRGNADGYIVKSFGRDFSSASLIGEITAAIQGKLSRVNIQHQIAAASG